LQAPSGCRTPTLAQQTATQFGSTAAGKNALDDDTGGCRSYNGTVESPAITVRQALVQIASSADKFLERPGPGELQTIYSAVAQDIAHGTSSLIN
jgi:hypothetical protein